MNEFYGSASDVNFENGDPSSWVIVSGPLANSGETTAFYKPQMRRPGRRRDVFPGGQSVWRTQDSAGTRRSSRRTARSSTMSVGTPTCGDLVPLGGSGLGKMSDLTSTNYGADSSAGGYVVSLARASSNTGTLWAATATGRVFISENADAADASSVTFTRLDSTSSAAQAVRVGDRRRFHQPEPRVDHVPGYNANTPSQPGHVFGVLYNPGTRTATWTNIDHGTGPLGDLPVTGVARDNSTGTLYAATDFGVLAYSHGAWVPASTGMPEVETPWITIDQSTHTLYAATHGRGIWSLSLASHH